MSSSEGKAFGELLGQFRTKANLTQQQLAKLMGKSRGTIINWENGTYLPKERALVLDLAKHLHLDGLKRDQLLDATLFDPLGTVWTIPFQRNPFFTGREDILNSLQKALHGDKTIALMQPQALKGLGGIGKTHTAIEYAYRHRDEYQTILWAPAATSSDLQASLVSIATKLNLPEKAEREEDLIVKAVKRWLMNHSDWLLILDNVEDLESVQSLYPWAHSGHVIITTRSQSVGSIALSIPLEKMEPEEGALFLLHRTTLIGPNEGKEQAKGTDYEKAKELSEVLGGLPLALDQAAAYVEETRCGLSTYLKLYQIERTNRLNDRGRLTTTDHPETVTITFSLAFQKVVTASPAAGELLLFCAFLSPDVIPEEIITNEGAYLGPSLESIATDIGKFNEAIRILLAYSLTHRDTDIETGTQTLSVHRLVQAVLQDQLSETERRTWAERAMLSVNAAFPHGEHSTWPQCERLLPNALLAVQYIRQYQIISEDAGYFLYKTTFYLLKRGRYEEAELLFSQTLSIWDKLGPEHPKAVFLINTLAELYYLQGKYAAAELLFLQVLHLWKQQLGAEHPNVAHPLNNLAVLYKDQGRYKEAEPLYQQALRIRMQQLGAEHIDVAASLNNLALLYKDQGRYEEAESLYQQALQIYEQQIEPEHPNIAHPLNNLAILYKDQGRYKDAEPLYQRALRIWEKQLGPEHPQVAYPLHGLAELYQEQGQYAEAKLLYLRALQIWEQQFGSEHPKVAYPLNGLANLYREQGNYGKAEPLYQRALRIWEQQFGPNHPETAETLHDLATFHEIQGNCQEALSLYQRALVTREQVLGPAHPKTQATHQRLTALQQLIRGEK